MKNNNISSLLISGFCPICKSSNFTLEDGMSTSGKDYLNYASAMLNVSLDNLIETIKVYKCITCQNFFCDPWLNVPDSSRLFSINASEHISGWANFEHFLTDHKNHNSYDRQINDLINLVVKKIPIIKIYGELGCPFQGFLMELKRQEVGQFRRISRFHHSLERNKDSRLTKSAKLYSLLSEKIGTALIFYYYLKATFIFSRGKINGYIFKKKNAITNFLDIKIKFSPEKKYLLTRDGSNIWGANCVRYGKSCKYFSSKVLDAAPIPLVDILGSDQIKFDLIGVFNVLDHYRDPITILKDAISISNNLIVVTHAAKTAGKQHLFGLGEHFFNFLSKELANTHHIEDLSTSMNDSSYSYVLITQKGLGDG